MLKQRVITAAIGIPLFIILVWFGGRWFSILIAVVVLIGTLEFLHITGKFDRRCPLTYFGLLWSLAVAMSPHYKGTYLLPIVMTTAVMVSLVWLLFYSPREKAFRNWAWMLAGVVYIGWMLSYWVNLRALEDGMSWVYLAIFATFANDSGAFFVGKAWGKHHLALDISPGKTKEGALGGLLSAIVVAVIVSRIPILFAFSPLEYWQAIVLGCLISVFAQLGDLVESLLKRNAGVKESGNFLPGHGGILDRFDSLIFVGAMVYYYAICIMA